VRGGAAKFRARMTLPTPLPCFLEVLILGDFKSLFPEVLILGDFKSFAPEVLILVGLKSFGMSAMEEFARFTGCFLEVLILVEIKRDFSEVLILQGLSAGNLWGAAVRLGNTEKDSTNYTCVSI
jgi:hypothetical protein